MLEEGQKAPQFTGKNQHGKEISLTQFAGKKVILYFYPKDNTPGCTAEACNLNENKSSLTSKNFEVIGVSPDTESSHLRFAEKFNLQFNLISDTDKKILKDYGAWGLKKNYGKEYEGVIRTTFIIDEKGMIEKIIKKVDTAEHTAQIYKLMKIQ